MSTSGGFTATKLAKARDLLREMIDQSTHSNPDETLNWLSFLLVYAQLEPGFFVEAVKREAFNIISTTCGTLDHDIARSFANYYHGAFELDDIELGKVELMRLGNVVVPNSSYGEVIESVLMPILEDIRNDRIKSTGKQGSDVWLGFGSIHLIWKSEKE